MIEFIEVRYTNCDRCSQNMNTCPWVVDIGGVECRSKFVLKEETNDKLF